MNTNNILSNSKRYHCMPYKWKKEHPGKHSCAVCINRPIDFCKAPDSHRYQKEPAWVWKEGVTNKEIVNACAGTLEQQDTLKIYRPCPNFSWSKTAPFYPNDNECFK